MAAFVPPPLSSLEPETFKPPPLNSLEPEDKPGVLQKVGTGLQQGSVVARVFSTKPNEPGGIVDTLGQVTGVKGAAKAVDDLKKGNLKDAALGLLEIMPVTGQGIESTLSFAKGVLAAKAAAQQKDWAGALTHLTRSVPALGPLVEGAVKIHGGKWAEGAGEMAGPVLDAVLLKKAVDVVGSPAVQATVGGAARGALEGAKAPASIPIKVKGVPLGEVQGLPASVAGGVSGAGVGHVIAGPPGAVVGGVAGALAPVIKGAVRGGKAALVDYRNGPPTYETYGTGPVSNAPPAAPPPQPAPPGWTGGPEALVNAPPLTPEQINAMPAQEYFARMQARSAPPPSEPAAPPPEPAVTPAEPVAAPESTSSSAVAPAPQPEGVSVPGRSQEVIDRALAAEDARQAIRDAKDKRMAEYAAHPDRGITADQVAAMTDEQFVQFQKDVPTGKVDKNGKPTKHTPRVGAPDFAERKQALVDLMRASEAPRKAAAQLVEKGVTRADAAKFSADQWKAAGVEGGAKAQMDVIFEMQKLEGTKPAPAAEPLSELEQQLSDSVKAIKARK